MTTTLRSALALFALLSVTVPARAGDIHDVHLRVTPGGDLKYTGFCMARVYADVKESAREDEVLTQRDLEQPLRLEDGSYHVVVECPSTEGTVKQTVPVRVKGRDVEQDVALAPGFAVVEIKRDGELIKGKVKLFDAYDRVVAEGDDRVVYPVVPGKVRVEAKISKRAIKRRRGITLEAQGSVTAGKKSVIAVDASDGDVLLVLSANRKNVDGIGALVPPGKKDRLVEVNAHAATPAPPGEYDIVTTLQVSHDFAEQTTKGVKVTAGKTTKVKVSHPVGFVEPRLVLDGKPVPDDEKIEIELFLGEAPRAFNTIIPGETATLSPGSFRLKARHLKNKLDDRSAFAGEAEVKVRAGRTEKPVIDLSPARLEVQATLGGKPRDLEVGVWREGAKAPFITKKAAAGKSADFVLPEGRFRVTATLEAPQGKVVGERFVDVKAKKTEKRDVDIDVGIAKVQVFEKGIAVPAEVRFILEGESAPALVLDAGRIGYLAPGTYTLVTVRKGKKREFAPIKVAAGREVERQLELLVQ